MRRAGPPRLRAALSYAPLPPQHAMPAVDLHSNLRLGPIWVKSGTEIETGASFSLNLSANFAALSGESGLLFDCGLPGFDDGVGYALGAGRDGVNGEFVKDAKDPRGNSV